MPPDLTPWAVILVFVSGLAMTVLVGLRMLMTGRIVAGRHYSDAREDEDRWRAVAEAGAETNRELVGHIGRLTSAIEQLTATTRETQQLTTQIMQHLLPVLGPGPFVAPPSNAGRET